MFSLDTSVSLKLQLSPTWKQRFMGMAREYSNWSKDPSTKVGAVAVDGDKKIILSAGYNGFPRGVHDNCERYEERETKYKYVVHAEMNVIYNASYNGVSLNDSILFVYGLPVCAECAKGIIQVGVKHVVILDQVVPQKWQESWEFTRSIFTEAGVTWEFIKPNYDYNE